MPTDYLFKTYYKERIYDGYDKIDKFLKSYREYLKIERDKSPTRNRG